MDELGYLERPGRQARHARRAGVPGRPGDRRHRHAPGAGDPARTTRSASTRASGGRPELGWEFMRAHCRVPDEILRFELNRYLGWPGQAPSYKVGERIWLQARDDAEGPQGRRLRPQGVPPGGARPRLARPRPAEGGPGPPLATRRRAPPREPGRRSPPPRPQHVLPGPAAMRPGGRSGPATGRSRARRTSATAGHAARTAALANSPRPDRPPRSRPTRRAHSRRREQPAGPTGLHPAGRRAAHTAAAANSPRPDRPPPSRPTRRAHNRRRKQPGAHRAAEPADRPTPADAPRTQPPPQTARGARPATTPSGRRAAHPTRPESATRRRLRRYGPDAADGVCAGQQTAGHVSPRVLDPDRGRVRRQEAGRRTEMRHGRDRPSEPRTGRPAGTHRPVTDGAPTTNIE